MITPIADVSLGVLRATAGKAHDLNRGSGQSIPSALLAIHSRLTLTLRYTLQFVT